MHVAACSQREMESKASLHHIHGVQRKVLGGWKSYVHHRQARRKLRAVAVHAWQLSLVRTSWGAWCSGLQLRQRHTDRLQAADCLAQRSTQRRALGRWKNYVELCIQESERDKAARQHHHQHLLRSGLSGLTLNVTWSKTHRLNKNVAVHHYHHSTTSRYWTLWQLRLEEAEDRRLRSRTEIALTNHSTLLLRKYMCLWREQLAEHRDLQSLERRAETWFSGHVLPQCLDSWVEFTLQRRRRRARRDTAELHDQQRLYAGAFYSWWCRSEEVKEQRLAERMAVLHDEQWCVRRAWSRWRRRAQQEQEDRGKQEASGAHYQLSLLHRTLGQWRSNVTDIRYRRTREEQADRHGELCGMRCAMIGWSKYVQNKREKNHRLEQMDRYHQSKLLKHTLEVWKEHQRQSQQIYSQAEESYSLQQQHTLRRLLGVWRENAALLAEVRAKEQRAETHFRLHLQAKLLLAWRQVSSATVAKHRQQREMLSQAQSHMDHLRLQRTLRRWRERKREVVEERTGTETARRHHRSTVLSRAFRAWGVYQQQHQRYEVLKRRGMFLLRQKTTKQYFECWKVALQIRGAESERTEQALWHWSLTLQAKVLEAWRRWAWERRRKQERLAAAAGYYRRQLLREGVAHVLTHAAHAGGLRLSLAQRGHEQSSRRLQAVVLRCALRWKRRALSAPGGGGGGRQDGAPSPPRKSVTFRLASPPRPGGLPLGHAHQPAPAEGGQDAVLNRLAAARASRLQPRRPRDLLQSPIKQPLRDSAGGLPADAGADAAPGEAGRQFLLPLGLHPDQPGHAPLRGSLPFLPPAVGHPELRPSLPPLHGPPPSQDLPPLHGPPPYPANLLLPPSSFMTTCAQTKLKLHRGIQLCLTRPVHTDVCLGEEEEEEEEEEDEECVQSESDPAAALTRELLDIRTDMRRHQQDRKQLQAWQRLKEVLKSWLQTSASEEETEERNATSLELEELEQRIGSLSAEVAAQKPAMLLHAARIQRIQAILLDPDPGLGASPR